MAPEPLFHSNIPISAGNQIYLARPRIDQLLEDAVQNPLVSVVAGAGYGKTHAVYSYVRSCNVHTAWVQLSERDNMGERFWENFTSAVALINTKSAERLMEMGFPGTEQQFARYLGIPEGGLIPEDKYIFVYDDLHLITDKTVLRFLEHSITSAFSNITSIIISRTEPALNLMKMTSKGLLAQITEEDLRFSKEEMSAYFRLQKINPSPQTASLIYRDTEGWAFAIHLAALSLKKTPEGTDYQPQALKSNIFNLIESEVMSPLKPELQRFLIKLSLFDHLSPDLLREIAKGSPEERSRKTNLLDGMESISSFVRFDTYHNAYHIHHLVLDYLTARQDELGEEEKKEVWAKVAAWCAANNMKMDAINYYEKAGDYQALMETVYTLPLLLPNNIARMLLEIFNRAPKEMFDHIPQASITHTRLYISLELFDKAREELEKIIRELEPNAASPAAHRTLTGCYNNLGYVGMFTSTYTRDYGFTADFEKAVYHSRLSGFQPTPPVSVFALSCYICRGNDPIKGELEKYLDALEKAVPCISESMNGATYGMDDLGRGELAMFRGDFASAEPFIRSALRKAKERDQYEIENRALFYLLRINFFKGSAEEIPDILKQMEAQLELPYYLNRFTLYDIFTGWFHIQIGQQDKAALWLRNDFEESDLNSISHGLETLVKAKYHLAAKRYTAALAVLTHREHRYGLWSFTMGRVALLALEAVCLYQLHDKEKAYQSLKEAYTTAQPEEIFMHFPELGKDMRTLTAAALKDGFSDIPRDWLERINRESASYAKKTSAISARFGEGEKSGSGGTGLLSRRELEVMKGLSQGLTREELARVSSISVNTVKSTIRNIYNKLGAVNRTDAVRIATELKLLK